MVARPARRTPLCTTIRAAPYPTNTPATDPKTSAVTPSASHNGVATRKARSTDAANMVSNAHQRRGTWRRSS
jgi:hypothetical protein